MNNRLSLIRRTGALAALLLAFAAPAVAENSKQALDRVFAFDPYTVLNMATGNANPSQDFDLTGITGSDIVTCTLTVVGGLYCLDGTAVRNWPDPLKPAIHNDPVNCNDPALGLDLKKGNPCTAMTVDLDKTIWLAARRHNSHSLYKIIEKPVGGCASLGSGWIAISGNTRCAKEMYFGRPPLVDLIPIDGDVAESFKPCPTCATGQTGVLGIEERKATLFYPDPQASQPIVVVDNKHGWGLKGDELLQEITLLQLPNSSQVVETTLLATTTDGRVLARNTSLSLAAHTVFEIPCVKVPGSVKCNKFSQDYGIRASLASGIAYVSDRDGRRVLGLQPNITTGANSRINSLTHFLTLETSDGRGIFPVIGLTIAQGISVDLSGCAGSVIGCGLINAPGGETAAASLKNVQLAPGSSSSATMFQVKDIPDCRYAEKFPYTSVGNAKRAICDTTPGVVIDPDGNPVAIDSAGVLHPLNPAHTPSAMRLNVTPLLPNIIKKAFKHSGLGNGVLPPLLISRQYRAHPRIGYLFEALFMLPQPGTQYVNTFESEFLVPELEGSGPRDYCINGPSSNPYTWDVATRVSELYPAVDGTYVDSMTNVGCNSIRGGLQGMSLLPYDLQVNPDTWGTKYGTWPLNPTQTVDNDAVFARLVQNLYDDLGKVQHEQVCTPGLLSSTLCSSLGIRYLAAKVELEVCVLEAFKPVSQRNYFYNHCQAALYWIAQYEAILDPVAPVSGDIANRQGELEVRVDVIKHVFTDRFLPSVPVNGFCREKTPTPTPSCPAPWSP